MATSSHVNRSNATFLPSEGAIDLERIFGEIAHTMGVWRSRIRYRGDLSRLLEISPHLITDIGLKPIDVREQVVKPFWKFQAPMHSE